jgi:HEAT repeat protein
MEVRAIVRHTYTFTRLAAVACAGVLLLAAPGAIAIEPTPAADRRQAAEALSKRAEAGDRDAIAALVPLLHAPDSKVRYHAYWGLVRAGEPAVAPVLTEYRRLEDDEARARTARVFAGIGLAARAALPEMRRELARPDSAVAGQAAAALGAMRAREALPDLVAAYAASRKLSNQRQMSRAMRRIGSDQAERQAKEQLVEAVRRELEDPRRETRRAALPYAVGLYRTARGDGRYEFPTHEELRPLVPGLLEALEDPDPEIALEAMRGLTLAGVDAAPAASIFARMLDDEATEHAARKALEAIDSPEARDMLARHDARAALERRVRTEYAAADHLSRTRLLPFWVTGGAEDGVRLEARFLTPGREPGRPERVVFTFESYSAESRLEGVEDVEWIADGSHLWMTGVDRSWSRTQLGVMERLSGALTVEDFLTLADAQRLDVRVGALRLTVPDAERMALRYFAGKIPPASPSTPAAAAQ